MMEHNSSDMQNTKDKKHNALQTEKYKNIIGVCLLIAFITLFIVGFNNGGFQTVLTKAANICLECIGIG